MRRHFNLKKKCKKTENSLLFSNDKILLLSLFPDNYLIKEELDKYSNLSILYDNKDEIFNILNEKSINRQKNCNFCNRIFEDKLELRKHILLECLMEKYSKKEIESKKLQDCNNSNYNNSQCNNAESHNTTSESHNNDSFNTTYNSPVTINNISIDMKCPISFNNDWDTTHIDFHTLNGILLSNHLIMTYLEEILKNDNNLNVILDNNDNEGLVYDESKYIKMKKETITDKTMDKINNDLNKFLEDDVRKEKIVKKYLDDTRERLEKKIIDFKNDNGGVKKLVVDILSKIYQAKRMTAIDICNNVKESEKKIKKEEEKEIEIKKDVPFNY
jgi:hypothetical protein